MNTGELHAITIQHGPETGRCQCQSCEFRENASNHVGILDMQTHAAQHTMVTGHVVIEFAETSMTVRTLDQP